MDPVDDSAVKGLVNNADSDQEQALEVPVVEHTDIPMLNADEPSESNQVGQIQEIDAPEPALDPFSAADLRAVKDSEDPTET